MKLAAKLLSVAAVGVSISFLGLTTLADNARRSGPGHPGGGPSGGFSSGYRGGYRGGFSGGFRSGYYGGYGHRYSGWGGWYPWNFSFSYDYAPSPYYYGGYYYDPYYYPPPVVYSSPPAVVYNSPPPAPAAESSQPPTTDRPLSPTAVDRDSPPPAPRDQSPPLIQPSDQGQSLGVADVKALVKAGLSEEVILSHIRNSQAVYHLTTAEIIDLKESGVSEKVIDFMINTASAHR